MSSLKGNGSKFASNDAFNVEILRCLYVLYIYTDEDIKGK